MHVYHQYTVRVPEDRDGFAARCGRVRRRSRHVYYPIPNHRLPLVPASALDLPETERAAAEVPLLPVHPSLSEADLERIVTAVNTVAKAGA